MIIYTSSRFTAFFGNAHHGLSAHEYHTILQGDSASAEALRGITSIVGIQDVMFLRQVHGNKGVVISEDASENVVSFLTEGDFLITNTTKAVGVFTADCLPFVMYDTHHNAVGVVHGGWRGLAQNIIRQTLHAMHKEYGTQPEDVYGIFGPCAKVCCYAVSENFLDNFDRFDNLGNNVLHRGEQLFFDLPGFARDQCKALGLQEAAMHMEYNSCTICTPTFNSVRRQGEQAGRQMTVVCLRP